MIELEQIEKDFYEKYLEFEKFLEFRFFDLTIKVNGRNPMKSLYASSIEDVESIRKLYDNEKYIAYVSCNTRPNKGRKDSGVSHRRTFFFDIELDGDKPPLSDEVYYQKLIDTAFYIWTELKKIKIDPNYLGESGRGLHIGIKIIPLTVESHDKRFRSWYKDLVERLMVGRPHKEIKFNDSMINPSRIQSCPGFSHNKYPEKPRRKVLKLFFHENNILPFLNRVSSYEYKKKKYFSKYRKKYNDKTFYQSPEWLLVANNNDLPEGEIHSKIWLMIKCLARDNGLDLEKLQERANALGYNEVIDVPPKEVQYNPWTLFNWAMKNSEYCLAKKIVLPFPFGIPIHVVNEKDATKNRKAMDFPIIELDNFGEIMRYIRNFNKATAKREGEKIIVFEDQLWKNLKKSIKNKYMFEYIEFLNLRPFIIGMFHTLDSDL